MTTVNPHLEGETRTGTIPLTSEVLLSDIAFKLANISEMLYNMALLLLLLFLLARVNLCLMLYLHR